MESETETKAEARIDGAGNWRYLAESGFHGINDAVDARQRAGEVQGHKQEEDGDNGGGDLLKQATVVVIFQLEQCSFAFFAEGYSGCLSGRAVRGCGGIGFGCGGRSFLCFSFHCRYGSFSNSSETALHFIAADLAVIVIVTQYHDHVAFIFSEAREVANAIVDVAARVEFVSFIIVPKDA